GSVARRGARRLPDRRRARAEGSARRDRQALRRHAQPRGARPPERADRGRAVRGACRAHLPAGPGRRGAPGARGTPPRQAGRAAALSARCAAVFPGFGRNRALRPVIRSNTGRTGARTGPDQESCLMQYAMLIYETPEDFDARTTDKTAPQIAAWRA